MSIRPLDALRQRMNGISGKPPIAAHPLEIPPPGSLVEWCSRPGLGASSANLAVVREALQSRPGLWVIVDPQEEFFSPSAWGWGVPLERMLVLHPRQSVEHDWVVEHCLRSPAVAVTWCWLEPRHDRLLRRWKRAAETGGGIGMLFRLSGGRSGGTGVDVRWQCHERQAGMEIRGIGMQLDYSRGGFQGGSFDVQVHDAAGDVRVVPPLADSANTARAAGA